MTTQRYRTPVIERTTEEALRDAEAEFRRVEEQYGRPSDEQIEKMRNGWTLTPPEICEWVGAWRELLHMKAAAGHPDGMTYDRSANGGWCESWQRNVNGRA